MNKVPLSLFTKDGGSLTKIIGLNSSRNGIDKDASQCRMSTGSVETVTIPFDRFGSYLRELNSSQAIAHGICGYSAARVVSEKNFLDQPGTVTRTKKYFRYSTGPGLGVFDHDPKPGQVALTPEEFRKIVVGVCPDFQDVATVYTPSTSSCIFDAEGKEITGVTSGFHLYFVAENAQVLPVFAETLFKRLCLIGHGYPFITRSGSTLLRTIFDASVFSPERLDFVSGAVCKRGCSQRLPDPVYTGGGMLKWTP